MNCALPVSFLFVRTILAVDFCVRGEKVDALRLE